MDKKKKSKKNKKWLKFRHRVVRTLLGWTLGVYSRIKYRIKVEKFKGDQKRPYLILLNHQTAFDQFFVGLAFKKPIYYLASEDLFSNGWVSSLIKYLVEPIPIKKQTVDVRAVLNCIRVAKEGGSIAIAPEGNRTYSGRTEYMSDAIAPLARKLGMPIALYRLEGGYGTHPRWSDVVRKGKMRGYVSRVIYPEEYAEMSDGELFEAIKTGLYVDEAVEDVEFRHKKSAEYLERALYVCPKCGLSEFYSEGDAVECKLCGLKARYLPSKRFEGIDCEFPFNFVADWYDYQSEFINSLDVREDGAVNYIDTADMYEVIPYERKVLIEKNATLLLTGTRASVRAGEKQFDFNFDDVSAFVVLGKNKLNVYFDGKIYQFKGSKRFNALKYVHIYHRYLNLIKGEENAEFLGL